MSYSDFWGEVSAPNPMLFKGQVYLALSQKDVSLNMYCKLYEKLYSLSILIHNFSY